MIHLLWCQEFRWNEYLLASFDIFITSALLLLIFIHRKDVYSFCIQYEFGNVFQFELSPTSFNNYNFYMIQINKIIKYNFDCKGLYHIKSID